MSLCAVRSTFPMLTERHYLGPTKLAFFGWQDEYGAMVFANPRSRHLPQQTWLELVRWCLRGEPNDGSRQWAAWTRYARHMLPQITTFVSYSDPAQGHTGALYRACNWKWAPTWLRLQPPPSGNGSWTEDEEQSVKDRWIFPLRPDAEREKVLRISDPAIRSKFADSEYREPAHMVRAA